MFKFEDLRKDHIVMNLIKCCNFILSKSGLDSQLLTYNIIPTGVDSGMLQIVQESITFYSIDKDYQDLWHFFRLENFDGQESARKIYDTFFKSAAVYSVVSFLLNVGDRHLDNIMVTKKGEFFHIDYGFILGEEPTFKKALGGKTPVRITLKMKETIQSGGQKSNGELVFNRFIELCSKIYLVLRRHYVLFMNMLLLLHKARPKIDYQFSMEYIEEELRERFLPGTSDEDAKLIFENVLSNGETILNYVTDMGHHVRRQKTFDRMCEAATSTIKGVFGAVWGIHETYSGTSSASSKKS